MVPVNPAKPNSELHLFLYYPCTASHRLCYPNCNRRLLWDNICTISLSMPPSKLADLKQVTKTVVEYYTVTSVVGGGIGGTVTSYSSVRR